MTEAPLLARLRDHRTVPIQPCNCAHCENEWFMAAYSAEWMPSFCPYCGTAFIGRLTEGEPQTYEPVFVEPLPYPDDMEDSGRLI